MTLTVADEPVAKLSENTCNALRQLRSEGDAHWKLAVRLLEREFDLAARQHKRPPKMKLYQDAAALIGQKSSTVRNWVGIYNKVGDALLEEHGDLFTYSHWRAIVPAARRAGKSIEDYAAEIAATADDYAGQPIPVDVIVARTEAGEKTPAEIFEAALDSARSDIAVMGRHINLYPRRMREALSTIARHAEDLAALLEVENKKRANQSGNGDKHE